MITILCALLVVLVHGCAATGSDKTQPVWISSYLRQHVLNAPDEIETGGTLVKVMPAGNSSQVRNVAALGTSTKDSTTKFYLETNSTKNADAIRYTEGNTDYYLCVESAGKVLLRKSNVFPSQNKYFFKVEKNTQGKYLKRHFKSMETGEYLHADGTSRVFMGAVPSSLLSNGLPTDRRTWFKHATPDFLYKCDCCGQSCGEVKCPYCTGGIDFDNYMQKKSFCLEKNECVQFEKRS